MEQNERPQQGLEHERQLPYCGLLIDFGKQRRSRIKRLKRGVGKLARQIQSLGNQSRGKLTIGHEREIVPVVLLYRYR